MRFHTNTSEACICNVVILYVRPVYIILYLRPVYTSVVIFRACIYLCVVLRGLYIYIYVSTERPVCTSVVILRGLYIYVFSYYTSVSKNMQRPVYICVLILCIVLAFNRTHALTYADRTYVHSEGR